MAFEMSYWQWALTAIGAMLVGLGKGGVAGVGNLTVVIFALVFPAKESVGLLLPILICADIMAVIIYRRHADWSLIKRIFPFTILGTLLSAAMLWKLDQSNEPNDVNEKIRLIIGFILIIMTIVHWSIRYIKNRDHITSQNQSSQSIIWSTITGLGIGFASMTANAAGPIASLYFISIKLPKYIFIGTSAWLFLIVNLSKVPFQISLGMINWDSFKISLCLFLFAASGAAIAPKIVKHINQQLFEILIWFFIFVAGVKMIF
jgi:uncharacterized membrane protein YfcA